MKDGQGQGQFYAHVFPDLSVITKAATQNWMPEVIDPNLRQDMLANKRLEKTILADILESNGIYTNVDPEPAEQAEILLSLLRSDLSAVTRCCGMIWHAQQISSLVMRGEAKAILGNADLEDVRLTLRSKEHSGAPDMLPADLDSAVHRNGRICLSAWLNDLPQPFRTMLFIVASPLGEIFRIGSRSREMASIASICIAERRLLS